MQVVLDVQPAHIGGELGVARALAACVHAAAEHNLVLLENHPQTPALYQSGARFQVSPRGIPERVQSIVQVSKDGGGDCADLCAWRLAELWRDDLKTQGKRVANCKVYWRDRCPHCRSEVTTPKGYCPTCSRPYLKPAREYHAEVRRADGTVEDPSRLLGM
jgi:hypothetical protein